MFYTKYRPQKFSEIIKPNEAADSLSKQVKEGKTVHAYLFMGPRGTGKTTTARILAKALNCTNLGSSGDPCGKCKSCVSISEGSFIDLIEIDAASNRGIDDIRELRDKIKLSPVMGKKKVYIIDEVHMLTTEAFNALLKTLEEPPKNVVFILCTTEVHKVPETIKSRCQVFRFKRASVKQIVSKLKEISQKEKVKVSDKDLEKIARASLGGFRDAETLLQQVTEGGISIESLLGTSTKDIFIELIDYLLEKDTKRALILVSKVYEDGVDLYVWLGEFLKYLRELLLLKSGDISVLDDDTSEIAELMSAQVTKIPLPWLFRSLNLLIESHKNIKSSFIPQLPIELAIAEICSSSDSASSSSSLSVESSNSPKKPFVSTSTLNLNTKAEKNSKEVKNSKSIKESVSDTDSKLEASMPTKTAPVSVIEEEESPENESDYIEIEAPIVEINIVEEKWKDLLKRSKEVNSSINALLKSGKVVRIEGTFIIFEVFYPFHKERIESPKNRKIIEDLLSEIYAINLSLKCELGKDRPKNLKKGESGILTDLNIQLPEGAEKGSLLDMLDGGLPQL